FNVDPNFNGSVTLALANNPGAAILGGKLTVQAAGGRATFNNLTLSRGGGGYTFVASSGLLSSSSTFDSPLLGLPTQLVVTSQPPATVTAGTPFSLTVKAEDGFGNVAPIGGPVQVFLAANTSSAILNGPFFTFFSNGVATLSNLSINTAGTFTID